jgi:hypothetical protein
MPRGHPSRMGRAGADSWWDRREVDRGPPGPGKRASPCSGRDSPGLDDGSPRPFSLSVPASRDGELPGVGHSQPRYSRGPMERRTWEGRLDGPVRVREGALCLLPFRDRRPHFHNGSSFSHLSRRGDACPTTGQFPTSGSYGTHWLRGDRLASSHVHLQLSSGQARRGCRLRGWNADLPHSPLPQGMGHVLRLPAVGCFREA